MTSTTFIDKTTLIEAPWLNDVDALVYQGQLDDGTTGASISRYLPAGTGAVATTVQDVLRREIWVEDFGAVADGAWSGTVASGTDNLAAFNLALAAATVLKTNVRAQGGLYYLSAGFTIPRGVKLFGDGETWAPYVQSGSATRGTGLLINGQVGSDCVTFEENAGHTSLENISIYNTNTNTLRSIVAVVGQLYPRMNRVEIGGLRDCGGVGLLLYPSATGALYETLWGDFNSVKVAGGVHTGLKIQGRAASSVCNTNTFIGGDIGGRVKSLIIDSDTSGADSINCSFHGTRFEGSYDAGTPPTFVADAVNVYGYATTSCYVFPIVDIGYSDTTAFFGCYFEATAMPGSYNDGTNGAWPVIGVIKTTTSKSKNTKLYGTRFVGCYLYDTGDWTEVTQTGNVGNRIDNSSATSVTVRVNAVQSIPAYVFTKVVFGAVFRGNDNFLQWDATNNTFICRSPGTYMLLGQVTFAGWVTAGTGAVSRIKTGTGVIFHGDAPGQQGGGVIVTKCHCLLDLVVGDTVWMEVLQTQGVAQNTNATAADNYFSIVKL